MDGVRAERARDHRLEAALGAAARLAAARAELERHSWREPVRHVQARRAVAQAEATRARALLPPEELQSLALRVIQLRLLALREPGARYGSHRHALHPEVDPYFDELVDEVAAEVVAEAARSGSLPVNGAASSFLQRRRANELPELLELLSAPAVRTALTEVRDRMRSVAADSELFTRHGSDGRFFVQHAASGLRAQFQPDDAQPGVGRFGFVYAKHYNIPSIDPSGAEGSPHIYEGLGIGAMIYRRGAAEFPDMRWRGGVQSEAAQGLRRRLHAEDPYIWDASCPLCAQHFHEDNLDWTQRAREDFPPH
jgi:hypothetical protein